MLLAYFMTWTTYGTWLPGSGKGSVDRRHNVYGTPFVMPDPVHEAHAGELMKHPGYDMNEAVRIGVRDAIVEMCQEKSWHLYALHVRTNHVHIVLFADRKADRLLSELKARASRELSAKNIDAHPNRWTRGGSKPSIFTEASLEGAIRYTLDEQGPRMAYYDASVKPKTQ
jgi:REP element-mobilizing transposase RayT